MGSNVVLGELLGREVLAGLPGRPAAEEARPMSSSARARMFSKLAAATMSGHRSSGTSKPNRVASVRIDPSRFVDRSA